MTTAKPKIEAVPDEPNENAELIAPPDEPPAANVVEALRRVMRDLPAIGKEGTGPATQGNYKYRGIEQITKHASGLFARHGILMTPHSVEWRPTRELASGGKTSLDESVLVTYRVYGPGGPTDFIDVQTPGVGRDNSDKASNKAMTAAYKYALTQTLCIADEKDDGDAEGPTADAFSQTERAGRPRGPDEERTEAGNTRRGPRVLAGWADIDEQRETHEMFKRRVEEQLTEPQRQELRDWRHAKQYDFPMTVAQLLEATQELERIAADSPM